MSERICSRVLLLLCQLKNDSTLSGRYIFFYHHTDIQRTHTHIFPLNNIHLFHIIYPPLHILSTTNPFDFVILCKQLGRVYIHSLWTHAKEVNTYLYSTCKNHVCTICKKSLLRAPFNLNSIYVTMTLLVSYMYNCIILST